MAIASRTNTSKEVTILSSLSAPSRESTALLYQATNAFVASARNAAVGTPLLSNASTVLARRTYTLGSAEPQTTISTSSSRLATVDGKLVDASAPGPVRNLRR